jgi:hypothetical protein
MSGSVGALWQSRQELALIGALVVWIIANLLAVGRRPDSAVAWYRLSGLIEAACAAAWGLARNEPAWTVLAVGWAVVKGVAVPWILRTALPSRYYGALTAGTPRLLMGSGLVLAVSIWTLGPLGGSLAALLTPFWLLMTRREIWVGAMLLIEAEIALGFVAIGLGAAPVLADWLALSELVAMAVLLAWLLQRGREDHADVVTVDRLRQLEG